MKQVCSPGKARVSKVIAPPRKPKKSAELKKAVIECWDRFLGWKQRGVVLGSAAFVLGTIAVILSTSVLLQGPTTEEANAAEWLSAISTFWGAIATALGAILTAGAVLVAALSYRKQVADRHQELVDKHEAQAIAVTVGYELHPDFTTKYVYFIENGSDAGIYNVRLFAVNDKEQPSLGADVIPAGKRLKFDMAHLRYLAAAEFDDSAGVRWLRDSKGRREQIEE